MNLGLKVLLHDRNQFIPSIKGWKDGRDGLDMYDAACWCHGSSGIALSRLIIMENNNLDTKLLEQVLIAKDNIISIGIGGTQSLCHGDLGNLDVYRAIGLYCKDQEILNFVDSYLQGLINAYNNKKQFKTGEDGKIPILNLFMGKAGIGYGFLRQYDWANVPSVLTLESANLEFKFLH